MRTGWRWKPSIGLIWLGALFVLFGLINAQGTTVVVGSILLILAILIIYVLGKLGL